MKLGFSTGISCPVCGSRFTRIIDSRGQSVHKANTVRRRRVCENLHRFTTYEVPVDGEKQRKEQLATEIKKTCGQLVALLLQV